MDCDDCGKPKAPEWMWRAEYANRHGGDNGCACRECQTVCWGGCFSRPTAALHARIAELTAEVERLQIENSELRLARGGKLISSRPIAAGPAYERIAELEASNSETYALLVDALARAAAAERDHSDLRKWVDWVIECDSGTVVARELEALRELERAVRLGAVDFTSRVVRDALAGIDAARRATTTAPAPEVTDE